MKKPNETLMRNLCFMMNLAEGAVDPQLFDDTVEECENTRLFREYFHYQTTYQYQFINCSEISAMINRLRECFLNSNELVALVKSIITNEYPKLFNKYFGDARNDIVGAVIFLTNEYEKSNK